MDFSVNNNSAASMELRAMNILFEKYGSDTPVYIRGEKLLLRDEIPIEYFPEDPDVMDDLGLTQQREDMTKAQNKMIALKNQISYDLEMGNLFPELKDGEKKNSPFNFSSDLNRLTDDEVKKRRELMETALHASALTDPEYRALAAEYLDALLPAARKRKRELQSEINSLEAEYAQLKLEYEHKIRNARRDLKKFMQDLDEVTVKRIQLTDTGKASAGGLPPVELNAISFWKMFWIIGSKNVIERLQWIRDRISDMDQDPDEEEMRATIRSNWKSSLRDGSGSDAPIGGVFSSLFGKRG